MELEFKVVRVDRRYSLEMYHDGKRVRVVSTFGTRKQACIIAIEMNYMAEIINDLSTKLDHPWVKAMVSTQ